MLSPVLQVGGQLLPHMLICCTEHAIGAYRHSGLDKLMRFGTALTAHPHIEPARPGRTERMVIWRWARQASFYSLRSQGLGELVKHCF